MSVVGIDLGTTNTVIACVRGGRVQVLADETGRRLLPSVVSFHPNGEVLVGQGAKERRVIDARNTVASVKRLIGRSWKSDEIAKALPRFAFEMKEGPGHAPLVVARGREYTLPEISSFILRRAKQIAEQALGEPVDRAVITVPANFNELQRASTKVAGRVAALDVLRILNEPTAAALAYGLGRAQNERVCVYDFGGGTFDCTLLDLSGNVFEVLATAGDSFLGGDDVDSAIAERMADAFLQRHRVDLRADPQAFERLRIAAEQVKIELATQERAQIGLKDLAFGAGGAHLELDFALTRAELEVLATPFVERTFKVCQDALALAGLATSAFDKVILVGGSTQLSVVRRRVAEFFAVPLLERANADELVGIGAAIQAAALTDVAKRRSIPPPPAPRVRMTSSPSFAGPAPAPPAGAPVAKVNLKSTVRLQSSTPAGDVPASPAIAPVPPQPPRSPAETPMHTLSDGEDEVTREVDTKELADALQAPPPSAAPTFLTAQKTIVLSSPSSERTKPGDALAAALLTQMNDEAARARRPVPARAVAPHTLPLVSPLAEPSGAMPVPERSPVPIAPLNQTLPLAKPSGPPPLPAPQPQHFPHPPPRGVTLPPGPLAAPVLIDVTPRALVVETVGGFCDTIIPRNARIPCERTRVFSTGSDNQTVVVIRVAQGEDEQFRANTYLGELELAGLRAAPRGHINVAVTFGVDASGTLQVRAADMSTAREARATLQLVAVAGDEAVARMTEHAAKQRVVGAPS